MRSSKPFIKNRNKLGASKPIFVPNLVSGNSLKDVISQTGATVSISGARWGIVNGVVAQFAANVPPVEDEGLRGCPAFTQLAKYTEDLTNAAWAKNKVLAPTLSSTYQGQALWKITESTENGSHSVLQTGGGVGVSDNTVIGLSFVYKSDGRALQIVLRSKDGTYPSVCIVEAYGVISSKNASAFTSSESLGDGLYRVTAAIPCGVGAANPYIYWQMWNDSTGSYTGDGVSGVLIGQPTYINFGVNGVPFIPPYVPNNTTSSVSVVSEAATASTGTSFDLDLPVLSQLNDGLRGKAVGTELANPSTAITQTIDGSNYTMVNGSVFRIVSSGTRTDITWNNALTIGRVYEILCTPVSATGLLKEGIANTPINFGVPTRFIAQTTTLQISRNIYPTDVSFYLSVREVHAQGHIELEFESNVDSGWLANGTSIGILSANNNITSLLYYQKSSDGLTLSFRIYDGSNIALITGVALTVGQTFRIFIDYGTYTDGSQKMRLTVNGVKSSVVAFSGSFGAQDLRFFFGNTVHFGWIKKDSLKYYERPRW